MQAWKEKLGQILQIMTKVSKNLKEEENMVGQAKNNIKKIDRKIIEAQNPFTRLFDVAHTTSAVIARYAAIAV